MKPRITLLVVAGIVLALLGVAMLAYEYLMQAQVQTLVDSDTLRLTAERDHTFPTIAAVVAIIAGLGLAFAGQRRI
jgi:drug/metabolite transporter (DMT)-like permease